MFVPDLKQGGILNFNTPDPPAQVRGERAGTPGRRHRLWDRVQHRGHRLGDRIQPRDQGCDPREPESARLEIRLRGVGSTRIELKASERILIEVTFSVRAQSGYFASTDALLSCLASSMLPIHIFRFHLGHLITPIDCYYCTLDSTRFAEFV